jgi:hypothetical protein
MATNQASGADALALPEHEKLRAIQPLSQAIYDFLEWCGEQGFELVTIDEHERPWPLTESRQKMLARHFGIDLDVLEREKLAILDAQRKLNERASSTDSEAKR